MDSFMDHILSALTLPTHPALRYPVPVKVGGGAARELVLSFTQNAPEGAPKFLGLVEAAAAAVMKAIQVPYYETYCSAGDKHV